MTVEKDVFGVELRSTDDMDKVSSRNYSTSLTAQ
jgi:hypothetical protein